jgi:alkylated DNA nucleotide flippase Atl1
VVPAFTLLRRGKDDGWWMVVEAKGGVQENGRDSNSARKVSLTELV